MNKRILNVCLIFMLLFIPCLVLTACSIGKKKLEFYVNGELYEIIRTSGNEQIKLPDVPTSSEQIFDGWYFEGTSVEFTCDTYVTTELTANKKIVAKMVDLFMFNDEEQEILHLTDRAKELVINLTIPSKINGITIKKIGNGAFYWNEKINSVSFSNTIEIIGEQAFYECNNIKSIKIPASVKEIGNSAFSHLWRATELTFEDNSQLVKIGNNAFDRWQNLSSVIIPASVQTIGDSAFYQCTNLETLIFENNSQLTSIGDQAFYQNKINTLTLPSCLRSLGYSVFAYCESLKYIIIPSSVLNIGNGLFYYTNKDVLRVYCEATAKPSGWDEKWAFGNNGYNEYQVNIYWGDSWTLVNNIPEPI